MNLLAIDCTEAPLTVAATNGSRVVLQKGSEWQKSGEQILSLIQQSLIDLRIQPTDLNAVALSSGPGSFTALRIGIATAKGLCFANDIPLILIPTFEAMATSAFPLTSAETLFTVAYSKADEFYVGVLQRDKQIKYRYLSLDELKQEVKSYSSVAIVGRHLSRWKSYIEHGEFIDGSFFTAEFFLSLALEKFDLSDFSDLATAEPLYLKNFEAKKKAAK